MNCWAVIPIKASENSKSRLAGVLGNDERVALVDAMLGHVVGEARAASRIDRVCLVGPSRHGMKDLRLLPDPGRGLNAAVQSALTELSREGPDRLIFIAGDLPEVTALELDLLAVAPIDTVAIAPDRHGTGTNAISLPLPAGSEFAFAFGTDSFVLHSQEAQRRGLRVETVLSRGLENDVDEPADLPDAASVFRLDG